MRRLGLLMVLFILMSCQNKTQEKKREERKTSEKQELKSLTKKEQLLQNIMYAHQNEEFKKKNQVEFTLHLTEEIKDNIKTKVSSDAFKVEFSNDTLTKEVKLFARLFILPYTLNYDDFELDLIKQKEINGIDQDVFKVAKQSEEAPHLKNIQTQSNTHLVKSITLKDDEQLKTFIYQKYISVSGITIPIQIDYYQEDELIQRLSIQRISFK